MVNSTRLLQFFLVMEGSAAWGPIFEPLKGGFGRNTFVMRVQRDDRDHDEDGLEETRSSGSSFFFLDDPLVHVERLNALLFQDDTIFLWESDANTVDNSFDTETDCVGDDCEEECLIPEHYKQLAAENPIDVLAFLGIQRAEPLQSKQASSWE